MITSKPAVGEGHIWLFDGCWEDVGKTPTEYLKSCLEGPLILPQIPSYNPSDFKLFKVIYSVEAMVEVPCHRSDLINAAKVFPGAEHLLSRMQIDAVKAIAPPDTAIPSQLVILYNPAAQILDVQPIELDRFGNQPQKAASQCDTFFIVDTRGLTYEECRNWSESAILGESVRRCLSSEAEGTVTLYKWIPGSDCSVYQYSSKNNHSENLVEVFKERIHDAMETESFAEWSCSEAFGVSMSRNNDVVFYHVELFDLIEYFEKFMPTNTNPKQLLDTEQGVYVEWLKTIAVRVLELHGIQIKEVVPAVIGYLDTMGDRAEITYKVTLFNN